MDQSNLIDYSYLILLIPIGIKYSDFEFSSKIQWKIANDHYEFMYELIN